MELQWNADLLYQIAMLRGGECVVIDSDSEEEEEEMPLQQELENEEYIVPNTAHHNNGPAWDGIVNHPLEEPEIEIVFDSKMPPLIPLTIQENLLENSGPQNIITTQFAQPPSQASILSESSYVKLLADLHSLLECKVCYTIINTSPVHCCSNGHPTCPTCWARCHRCPVCRVPCHSAPLCFAQTANDIIRLIRLPCKNKYRGCMVEGEEAMIGTHQETCLYKEAEEVAVGCDMLGCMVGH